MCNPDSESEFSYLGKIIIQRLICQISLQQQNHQNEVSGYLSLINNFLEQWKKEKISFELKILAIKDEYESKIDDLNNKLKITESLLLNNRQIVNNFYNTNNLQSGLVITSNNSDNFSVNTSIVEEVNNIQGDNISAVQGDNNSSSIGDGNQTAQEKSSPVIFSRSNDNDKDIIVNLLNEIETLIKETEILSEIKVKIITNLIAVRTATEKERTKKN